MGAVGAYLSIEPVVKSLFRQPRCRSHSSSRRRRDSPPYHGAPHQRTTQTTQNQTNIKHTDADAYFFTNVKLRMLYSSKAHASATICIPDELGFALDMGFASETRVGLAVTPTTGLTSTAAGTTAGRARHRQPAPPQSLPRPCAPSPTPSFPMSN
ncbi:hypothetical protein BV22DRAFT_724660 [Leucogyrophana mollusca]|uniref:Uncharacterized protein n=1 Tax=Leucogyrophana mollusca TaxID=85980 RepID=A0ACB8B8J2_9AGAM|nr:hypothetical protein BV22DRAFT_724660 [Leucogyrophana mollusca]